MYEYMVKIEYSDNNTEFVGSHNVFYAQNTEFVGSHNVFYAHWLYETETRCGHKCKYYELIDGKYEERTL